VVKIMIEYIPEIAAIVGFGGIIVKSI